MALRSKNVEIEGVLELIHSQAIIVSETVLGERVCSDPEDDKFLACALESKAMLVVSGDAALLKTNGYKGVHVLKPALYLAQLNER